MNRQERINLFESFKIELEIWAEEVIEEVTDPNFDHSCQDFYFLTYDLKEVLEKNPWFNPEELWSAMLWWRRNMTFWYFNYSEGQKPKLPNIGSLLCEARRALYEELPNVISYNIIGYYIQDHKFN